MPLTARLAPTLAPVPPPPAAPIAAAAILPDAGIRPSCVECAIRLRPPLCVVTVELSIVARTCSATWFQPRPAPYPDPCVPMPSAPATATMMVLSLDSSATLEAITSAFWMVARISAPLSWVKTVSLLETILMPIVKAPPVPALPVATPTETPIAVSASSLIAPIARLLSVVALVPSVRLARRLVPMIPALVSAASWLKPTEAPTPLVPVVPAPPPPIAMISASLRALIRASSEFFTLDTSAPSISALVVSTS